MSDKIVDALEKTRRLVYRGPVKRAVQTLGFERTARRWYSKLLFAFSKKRKVGHTISGIDVEFLCDSGMEVQRLQNLHEERSVIERLLADLREDDTFYDVGANIGIYSCFAASIDRTSEIVAFEPHPNNAKRLKENVALNRLEEEVTIRESALADANGTGTLSVMGTHEPGEGTHSLGEHGETDTIEIDLRTAESIVDSDECPFPNVVKIDVEGAEGDVLTGFGSLLEDQQLRAIYCEIHTDRLAEFGWTEEEIITTLRTSGFEIEILQERNEEKFIRAARRPTDD